MSNIKRPYTDAWIILIGNTYVMFLPSAQCDRPNSLQHHTGHKTPEGGQHEEVAVSDPHQWKQQGIVPGLHLHLFVWPSSTSPESDFCGPRAVSAPASHQPHHALRGSAAHGDRSGSLHTQTRPPKRQKICSRQWAEGTQLTVHHCYSAVILPLSRILCFFLCLTVHMF